jgi:hypothetical protein
LENSQIRLIIRWFVNKCIEGKKQKTYTKQLESSFLPQIFVLGRIKSYGSLKFWGEVWTGWAYTGANEEELTTWGKKGGQEGGPGGQLYKKEGPRHGRRATSGLWPEASQRPTVAHQPQHAPPILSSPIPNFFNFLEVLLGNFLAFWENACTTPPFFEACPYTWKC